MATLRETVAAMGPLFGVIGAAAFIGITFGVCVGIGRAWDRHLAKKRVRRLR